MKSTWSPGPISHTQASLSHELWKVPHGTRNTTAPTRPPPGLTNTKPSSTWGGNSLGLVPGWSSSYSSGTCYMKQFGYMSVCTQLHQLSEVNEQEQFNCWNETIIITHVLSWCACAVLTLYKIYCFHYVAWLIFESFHICCWIVGWLVNHIKDFRNGSSWFNKNSLWQNIICVVNYSFFKEFFKMTFKCSSCWPHAKKQVWITQNTSKHIK